MKTFRGDTLARAIIPGSEECPGAKLLMASGYQIKVFKANEKCEHHILVDISMAINS